jgi:hypothetical protein
MSCVEREVENVDNGGYSLKRGVSSAGCECKVWSVEAPLSEDELDFS